MSTSTFTAVHVVLSLIGIFSGLIVLFGMFSANRLTDWTALFLVSTVLTSVTGFLFHSAHIRPSHVVGVISLVVLGRDPRALCLSARGALALDLCGRRCTGSLSEYLRRGG